MYPTEGLLRAWTDSFGSAFNIFSSKSGQIHSIEVKAPLKLKETESLRCTVSLCEKEFASSYGAPFLGQYQPDFAACGPATEWSSVVLIYHGRLDLNRCDLEIHLITRKTYNYLASVSGRQFDRIGGVWIGGSPMLNLRYTSTEPSGPSMVTYWKEQVDVSEYMSLLDVKQPVVVSLDNIVDGTYTGIFNVSVSLDFYTDSKPIEKDVPDMIVPLSVSDSSYGWFSLPLAEGIPAYATLPPIPQTATRAQVKVYLSAHGNDEFWYSNVPNDQQADGIFGGGSFKEVQLFIDDKLVGLDWPFPTIYTGGINPLLWRPIVAIGTYHVPEIIFDVTPALPYLFLKGSHRIGFNITTAANGYWFVEGNLQIWTDKGLDLNHQFQGNVDAEVIKTTVPVENVHGSMKNELSVRTTAENSWKISGSILTSKGWKTTKVEKTLKYRNKNEFTRNGLNNLMSQTTEINSKITTLFPSFSTTTFDRKIYPLTVGLNYTIGDGSKFQFDALVDHGLKEWKGESDKITHSLDIHQIAVGTFGTFPTTINYGNQNQTYSSKTPEQCYTRDIQIRNRQIYSDNEGSGCLNGVLKIQ